MEPTQSKSSGLKLAQRFPIPVNILSVGRFTITALWNTGEIRENDFSGEMADWKADPVLAPLTDLKVFSSAILLDQTFAWQEPAFYFEEEPGTPYPRTIDPVRCYRESRVVKAFDPPKYLAQIIKSERTKAGLTQVELGSRIGYSSKYISKIERGISDVQFGVFEYILRVGFAKDIKIEPLVA